jgi:DNA-binding GntR family transcriptional regulator
MSVLDDPAGERSGTLRHDSLARSAADWIAEHIISGEIKPGEKLTETGLAERMGISRSPVREALQALSREGLITVEPRRGARVNRLNARDVADLYTCRLLLEPRCTAEAAAALTDAASAELESTFGQMTAAVAGHEAAEYLEALKNYNWAVLAACPNRVLSGYAQNTWRSSLRYWDLLVRGSGDYLAESLARNKHLHEAIRARFAAEAEHAAVEILEHGRDELLRILNQLSTDETMEASAAGGQLSRGAGRRKRGVQQAREVLPKRAAPRSALVEPRVYESAGERVVQVEAVRPHGGRPCRGQVERVDGEHEVTRCRPGPVEEDAPGGTAEKRRALLVGGVEPLDPADRVGERLVPPVQDRGLRAPHDALPANPVDKFPHPGGERRGLEEGLPGKDDEEALVGEEVRDRRLRIEDGRVRGSGEVAADRQRSRVLRKEAQQRPRPLGETSGAAADEGDAVGVADLIQ